MLILLILDPLSIIRTGQSDKEFFIKEMRFQAAGIINNRTLDSAIVGTSMAENFNTSEANEALGGSFINLSLSGSLLRERKVVLNHLLSSHNMKTIVISLDGATALQKNKGIPITAWSYLYNDSSLDDISVYTNKKYLPYINCYSAFNDKFTSFLLGECPKEKIRPSVELLTEWQSQPEHNSRFGGLKRWKENRENVQVKASIKSIEEANLTIKGELNKRTASERSLHDYAEFNDFILPLIRKNPETKFILFFPPYSLVRYAIDCQTNLKQFNDYKEFVKSIVLNSDKYSNIELYWFNDLKFIEEIKNYKDLTHYGAEFNSHFLKSFSTQTSIINTVNYKAKLQFLEYRASKLNLQVLAEQL